MTAASSGRVAGIDAKRIEALLLDADGTLSPSEEPAFVASAEVTNRMLAELGVDASHEPTELRLASW